MAVNKIARKSSKFRVVFTVPDFCWPPPPAPPSVPPIPFPLFADLGGAKTVAKDVRLNRKPAFVFKASKTDKTYGDEIALPGRKGVKSRTATKPAWPMRHSSSVKIRKRYIVRTGDMFHMNGKFSKRLPPKTCLSCKGAVGAGRPVNPIHGLKFLTGETDFAFEGILPLVWSRSYYSDQDGTGWLGEGWSVPGCQRIIRDAAGLAYIDDQGRLFPLPEVDEDDEEPVLFESEQIWFSKNPDGHYVIASLDGSIALRFAPLAVAEDGSDEDSTLFPLVAVEDANGNHQRFIYHPLTGLPQYVIDGNGRVFSLNFGNVADEQSPKMRLLSVSLLEGLPAFGETVRAGSPLVRYEYNSSGDLVRVIGRDGNVKRSFGYKNNLMVSHTDAAGLVSEYEYDQDGLPTRRTNALGHTFGYHYDKARRLIGLTNENGARYRFAYDVLDRLIAESGFDHKLTGYRYNAGNELIEQREYGDDATLAAKLMAQLGGQPAPKKDAAPLSDGLDSQTPLRITEFKRDVLGRLIHTLARDGGDRVQETAYQYDPNDNLVRAANSHSITCFDYNGNGQLIAQHQWKVPSKEENARNGLPETDWRDAQYDMLYLPVTETVRYHYDFNGNRTATVLPDGRQINYLYYGSGHLHQISLDDEVITDIERDRLHREIYRTQGKLASRYELDPLGRLKRQIATLNDLTQTETAKNAVTSAYAIKRGYGYDRTGNLTHSTDQRTGTTHFEYDRLGRITKAGSELFAFDPAHNILSDNNSPTITDNRLKTYNGTTYYYDHFGNLIHRELADGEVQNYFYDLHDQLVKAEIFKKDGTKETWAYSYDALGRRIGKGRLKNEEVSETSFPHDLSGNGLENQTRFVWDGSHLLQEIQPDGRYTYIYTNPDSYEPLAQVHNRTNEDGESCQQTRYFHCDQIGIPREMTDKDGNLLWLGNYTGWGRLKEETKVTDSAYQPFRLQNQYADRETGLHYNFFRYYEPDAGRFVNQDPIGIIASENLYAFAPNIQRWMDISGAMAQVAAGYAIGAPFGGPVGCAAGSTIALAATAVLAVGAAISAAVATSNSTSTTTCGTCNSPKPNCPPDVFKKLSENVNKAKDVVQKLGGCKPGMDPKNLSKRSKAWLNLALARSIREQTCWSGGDAGHQEAMAAAWKNHYKCKSYLT